MLYTYIHILHRYNLHILPRHRGLAISSISRTSRNYADIATAPEHNSFAPQP